MKTIKKEKGTEKPFLFIMSCYITVYTSDFFVLENPAG
ncbi:MAG: hypothetical protein ACFWUM_04360 [Eubacteriales bacterium]|jgi:hypothetical protein